MPTRDEAIDGARREAAAWLARLRADDVSAAQRDGFVRWLARSDTNRAAFEHLNEIWDALGGAARHVDGVPRVGAPVGRRMVLAGIAGGLVMLVTRRGAEARILVCPPGVRRRAASVDGLAILLDGDSAMTLAHAALPDRLDWGRACLSVDGRGRIIAIGDYRLMLRGADADASLRCGIVSVLCVRNRAVLLHPRRGALVLLPGDRVLADGSGPEHRDHVSLEDARAWTEGFAVFRDDRLDEAVAEMNRYDTTRMSIADPHVASMRVSGRFRTGDNAAFVSALRLMLPVTAGRDLIIRRRVS